MTLADPLVSDALSDSVDFLWYDQEHFAMSPEVLRMHLMAARGKGLAGIVRVAEGSRAFIKPVLDGGASGVIAPQVRTVEEVRQFVADCRYPPVGSRGYGPLTPSNYFRDSVAEHVQHANEGVFAAIMLETADAVEAIDEIVAVAGLDSIVIGPMDLSGSLGVLGDVEHPTVTSAMERVISSARAAGVYVGAGMGLDVDYGLTLARRGVQWFQMGLDITAMIEGVDRATDEIRSRLS